MILSYSGAAIPAVFFCREVSSEWRDMDFSEL